MREALEAWENHGNSVSAAADALKLPRETFRHRLHRARALLCHESVSAQGVMKLAGTSTLLDKDGNTVMQWVKTSADQLKQAAAQDAVFAALRDELKMHRYAAIAAPSGTLEDLLTQYTITDFHLGMLAWGEETGGEDWDTKIAEQLLMDWFDVAIEHAPAAASAVLANLGDFLHWDGLDAVTPQNKNLLDADTRFAKLVRVAIRLIRHVINRLLAKHQRVHVIMSDANHDPASSVWLREWLAEVYTDNPRVTVEQSADAYYCVEHGLSSLFYSHGHKRKIKDIDDVFVAKFREIFGRTKFSYAHLGHLHSDEVLETNLMKVERHRTLTPGDAYAGKGGWVSGRDAKVITYHKQFGEVLRMTVNPDMVREMRGSHA